jgi:hypothetical protein
LNKVKVAGYEIDIELFEKLTPLTLARFVKKSSHPTVDEEGKRRYDWLWFQDYNKEKNRYTPMWDRQRNPEDAGEGYENTNRFNDADKPMDGPLP